MAREHARSWWGWGLVAVLMVGAVGTALALPPPPPTLVAPANGATVPNPVTLSWTAATGATQGYLVQVAVNDGFTIFVANRVVTGATDLELPAINAGTKVWWKVASRFVDRGGVTTHGDFSLPRTFIIAKPPPWPAPVMVAPTAGSTVPAPVTFQWEAVAKATGYIVQVAKDTEFGMLVFHPVAVAGTSAVWNDPPAGTYHWRVRAVQPSGSPAPVWSAPWQFTVGGALPAPQLVSPTDGETGVSTSPTLEWDAVTGAAGYWVQVASADSFATGTLVFSGPEAGLTKTLKALPVTCDGLTLYWRVQATAGGKGGTWSDGWSFSLAH